MSENMRYYEDLKTVPPSAIKRIEAGRLKGMSNISPMWRIRRLTEIFGPCGIGWKPEIVDKRIIDGASGEKIATVDINLYIKDGEQWSDPIPGTGGSMLIANEKSGPHTSDEAFKMAYTDAISVAGKAIGLAADIYYSDDTGSNESTKYDVMSLSDHDILAIKKRVEMMITAKYKAGLDQSDLLSMLGINQKTFTQLMEMYDRLKKFEEAVARL